MDHAIASLSGNYRQVSTSSFDIRTLIESISAIGTFIAAVFAGLALRQSNKQLKIEQTPYMVLDHIVRDGNRYGFATKNVGRGPAVNITFNKSDKMSKRNDAFFSNDQQHSANFYPFEESHYWYVDGNVIDKLKHDNDYAFLYIFYNNQSDETFMTKVKIKRIKPGGNVAYVVMENMKGKVGV
jgi:hypothetical protein